MIEIGDGTVRTHWIDGGAGRNLAGPHRMVLGVLAESVDLARRARAASATTAISLCSPRPAARRER
jgi:hypothetical protein